MIVRLPKLPPAVDQFGDVIVKCGSSATYIGKNIIMPNMSPHCTERVVAMLYRWTMINVRAADTRSFEKVTV